MHPYGLEGVAFASVVPGLIFVPIYLWYTCKQLGLSVYVYLLSAVFPALVPAGVMAVILLGVGHVSVYDSYIDIIVGVVSGSVGWLVGFWFLVLNAEERSYVSKHLSRKLGRK